MLIKRFAILLVVLFVQQAWSQELFVRPDGGTWEQCDGSVNIAYDESITDRACAVNHLFELLEPEYSQVRISGGDIVTIANNNDGSQAEYIMGSHGQYDNGRCSSSWAYDCHTPVIPSGTAEQPTIIRGDGEVCNTKPILAGINRAASIFTIQDGEHIQLSCLRITDKSSCIGSAGFPNSDVICNRSKPYDKPFADNGITMKDSTNILFQDLDIEGLSTGIKAGRLGDVTLERVNLFANHSAGWNGDIDRKSEENPEHSINTGTIRFTDSSITFSGCGLIYNPGQPDHRSPHACSQQEYGGYGDGLGTAETAGTWIFDNVKVMHNISDGIDLLYQSLGGKTVVTNSRFEGNGGNALKASGSADIVNNILVANCGWNDRQEPEIGEHGEICRALGSPLVVSMTHSDTKVNIINNTVLSEGDCLLTSGNRTGIAVDAQSLNVVNNIFYALNDYHGIRNDTPGDEENSCMYYTDEPFPSRQIHNNVIHKVKGYDDPCSNFQENIPSGGSENTCTVASGPFYDNNDRSVITNPHYPEINIGIQYTAYDLETLDREANRLVPDNDQSPLVNAGYEGSVGGVAIPLTDYYGRTRNGTTDIGAIEFHTDLAIPLAPVILSVEVSQ